MDEMIWKHRLHDGCTYLDRPDKAYSMRGYPIYYVRKMRLNNLVNIVVI